MVKSRRQLCRAASALALLLLPALGSGAKHVTIGEDVLRTARVWIDGVPCYPPYKLEIVGDTAFVVNGVVADASPTKFIGKSQAPTDCDLVRQQALAVMYEARGVGLSDSAVVAAVCAVFNTDSLACGFATSRRPWQALDLIRRDSTGRILSGESVYLPLPNEQTTPKLASRGLLEQSLHMTEHSIASGGVIFWNRQGPIETCPASLLPRLLRDIRDAALGDSFTVASWSKSAEGEPRLMSSQAANAIARNASWVGR